MTAATREQMKFIFPVIEKINQGTTATIVHLMCTEQQAVMDRRGLRHLRPVWAFDYNGHTYAINLTRAHSDVETIRARPLRNENGVLVRDIKAPVRVFVRVCEGPEQPSSSV